MKLRAQKKPETDFLGNFVFLLNGQNGQKCFFRDFGKFCHYFFAGSNLR